MQLSGEVRIDSEENISPDWTEDPITVTMDFFTLKLRVILFRVLVVLT